MSAAQACYVSARGAPRCLHKTELEKFDRVIAQWRFPSDLDRLQSRNVVRGALSSCTVIARTSALSVALGFSRNTVGRSVGLVEHLPSMKVSRREARMLRADRPLEHVSSHVAAVHMARRKGPQREVHQLRRHVLPTRGNQRLGAQSFDERARPRRRGFAVGIATENPWQCVCRLGPRLHHRPKRRGRGECGKQPKLCRPGSYERRNHEPRRHQQGTPVECECELCRQKGVSGLQGSDARRRPPYSCFSATCLIQISPPHHRA